MEFKKPTRYFLILSVAVFLLAEKNAYAQSTCEELFVPAQQALSVVKNPRFSHPPMPRAFSIPHSERLFKAVSEGLTMTGIRIYSRTVKADSQVGRDDSTQYLNRDVNVTFTLRSAPPGAAPFDVASKTFQESWKVQLEIALFDPSVRTFKTKVPREFRFLDIVEPLGGIRDLAVADQFMPARRFWFTARWLARLFGPNSPLHVDRVSEWRGPNPSDPTAPQTLTLSIDLTNLTHAEFAALINNLAFRVHTRDTEGPF
jgi:hypothetical protein